MPEGLILLFGLSNALTYNKQIMKSPYFIGVIIFFVTAIISQIMKEKDMKLLSKDEKLKLLDSFSNLRTYKIILPVLIVGVLFGVEHLRGNLLWIGLSFSFVLLIGYFVIMSMIVLKGLRRLGICEAYQQAFKRTRCITFLGFVASGTCMLIPLFQALWSIWSLSHGRG